MTALLKPDVCVIGGGRAGVTLAMGLAAMQVPVVLVERGEVGAHAYDHVRLEAFYAISRKSHTVRTASQFGIAAGSGRIDWPALQSATMMAAERLRPNMATPRMTALGIQVVRAEASFEDRKTLIAGQHTIRARRFVLAIGADMTAPPIPGLAETPHVLLHQALQMPDLPRTMMIVGQDKAAVELAQAFARLGVRVDLIGDQLLAALPPEAADAIEQGLARDGVTVRNGMPSAIRKDRAVLKAEFPSGPAVTASRLLVQGRPAVEAQTSGLERAAVELGHGLVMTDRRLRTSNSRIFALGAVVGLSGSEDHDAGVILRNIVFRVPARRQPERLPIRIATDPGYAAIGRPAKAEASAQIRVFRAPFGENGRALAEGMGSGHMAITTDNAARVLGVSVVGRDADETLGLWAGLVHRRAPLTEVLALSQTYPSRADLGRNAALSLPLRNLTKPWVQRIIRFLRSFG